MLRLIGSSRPHSAGAALLCALTLMTSPLHGAEALPSDDNRLFALELQRRDPNSGQVSTSTERVPAHKIGIVVVDMWNWHWCKTSTMRVGALVPRMNRALRAARGLGMQVFLCPTDVADNYVGTPMVERLVAMPLVPVPHVRDVQCPPAPDGGGCTCGGKVRCQVNYGWDGMDPDLIVGPDDLMPNDQETLYSICQEKGITHLIYMGVHTQVCLLGKSIGLRAMVEAGLRCVLARDLTDAHGRYEPEAGLTPDKFTAQVVEHFEKHLAPTINLAETLERNGLWDSAWVVDPVRIAPWGTPMRPHLFEEEITVTLTTPWQAQAQIYYTLDGSAPTEQSLRYTAPLRVRETTLLKTVAYRDGRAVCLPSEGYFARLGAKPPLPDVYCSDLKALRAVGPGQSPSSSSHRFSPGSNPPQMDLTNGRQALRLRGQRYSKGLGQHAPSQLIYELKPEFDRFVASVGADEYILDTEHGGNVAMHPSVVFKVFIDGRPAAVSPVMRVSEEPWRFDIKIPRGSQKISLVLSDAGDGNRDDSGNWVNAGFVTVASRDPLRAQVRD
jgi:hypothetical protein